MKKNKLTTKLINNAFNFYNQNLGEAFTELETENLSKKLLNIIEYDHIIKDKTLPYDLPQYTLTIIYFIGEYKKAYKYASQDKKDKNKNTAEALEKGYAKKEKAYKENKEKINDKSLSVEARSESLFKSMIYLLLKKPSYNKVSILFLTAIYGYYPLLNKLFSYLEMFSRIMQIVFQEQKNALQTLEYTYLSKDKILNSSLIMMYTLLTIKVELDETKAFKYAKELLTSFIDDSSDYTDKYRKSYLVDKDIYCAGMYNGLPIYTWYTGSNQSYYDDEDIKKVKVLIRALIGRKGMGFIAKVVSLTLLKIFKKDATLKDIEIIQNKDEIIKWFKSSYKQSAIAPFTLFQHIMKPKKSIFRWIIALIFGIITKFAVFKTKFTK